MYRTDKNGKTVTIWDEAKGVGLRFTEGEAMQRYTSSVVLENKKLAETEQGLAVMNNTVEELTSFAASNYPKEFE